MRLAWLLTLMTLPPGQGDDVRVSATLNRHTALVGETVVLSVTVSAPSLRTPGIEDPAPEGLEILATRDRSSFRFSTAGGSVREFSREYTLRAVEAGTQTIAPIRVTVEDDVYETPPLRLTVQARSPAALPSGVGPGPGEEVAVRLWVEPDTAYVGQQVTMTVAAFFDPLVRSRLQRQPEYRPPDVQGFWTADIPGSDRPERRVMGRREYFVQVFRRALFPLSPGVKRIPPASVIYEVRRGLIYAPETFQEESSPARVVVLAPPEEGRPADFAGAVGQYEADIGFDRSDLRAGEAVNLVLEVRGSGNLSALARPELPEIPGVRVYEGGEDAEVRLRGTELAGHKRFSWVLVPERAGEFVVPELRLPYFDPEARAYRAARVSPVALSVAPATGTVPAPTAGGTRAIRYIKSEPAGPPRDLHREPVFWLVQAVPLGVLFAVLAVGRYRRGAYRRRRRPRRRGPPLKELRAVAESGDAAFFGELRSKVQSYLQDRLCIPGLAGRGIVGTQHALEDAGVPPSVTLQVVELLELCGRYRYSPDPPQTAERVALLERADRLLSRVDREAVSKSRLRALARDGNPVLLVTVVALALVSAQVRATAATQDGSPFAAGVGAYREGEYERAARLFERALDERPGDPNVLYNLGNAYYEMGRPGRAVAAWVRTLQRKPRDDDARFNLLLAIGDDPVLGSALPPVPLSPDELAVLLTALWFAGCGALLARQRWRSAYLTVGGGAALALALAAAALLLLPRSRYAVVADPTAVVRAGPVRQSEIIESPEQGTGYRVRERRDDWLRVSRGDSEGWVEAVQVEVVRPPVVFTRI